MAARPGATRSLRLRRAARYHRDPTRRPIVGTPSTESRPVIAAPFWRGIVFIVLATTLWGASGLFVRALYGYQLAPLQVVYFANLISGVALTAALALVAPRYIRLRWRAMPGVVALGLVGNGLSFVCYANAVALTGISLATLLLYTSPAWVIVLAWRFLGEGIGPRRVLAVGAAFAGCALVARVYNPEAVRASLAGLLWGLGSGFCYGLLSGALLLLPFQPSLLPLDVQGPAWPWLIAYVVGPALTAPLFFNASLRLLEAGLVSLLSLWELLVALVLAALLLGEALEVPQALGALLVISSVLLLRPGPAPAAVPQTG